MKHTYITEKVIDCGERVECDVCGEDFPKGDPRSGGFLFGSYAYCPKCAAESIERIKGYKEERYIKSWCPKGMSFHDWVMQLRGGDNRMRIISGERKDQ